MNSLRNRMLLNFLFLLSIVVVVTLVAVRSATYDHSTGQLLGHATTSSSVVLDKISNRANALKSALDTLSKDFSTKQLVASGAEDSASLLSAILNHQRRNQADIAWVLDPRGNTMVTTGDNEVSNLSISAQQYSDDRIRWLSVGGERYLLKSAPVKFVETSRNINAWIVMGLRASELINQELVQLTDMQIALLRVGAPNEIWGSTYDQTIQEQLSRSSINTADGLHDLSVSGEALIYAVSELGELGDGKLHLMLATVEDKAYLSYNSLLVRLIGILAVAAVLALGAAMLFSRSITVPITKLVKVADQIRQGEYVEEFPSANTVEVESLTAAVSDMQQGIKEREEEINQLAFYDTLTGLPNRNQFIEHINTSIKNSDGKHFVVMTLDLDRFKDINDTVGHETGDLLLKDIADRLRSYVYQGVFLAHLGGDEYGIVIDNNDDVNTNTLVENFSRLFERPFVIEQLTLDIDVSIGVSVYPEDATTPQGLLQCADIALYSCKGQHYRYAIYEPSLNKHSVQRLNLMSELRGALAEGQLQLYYQPKLSIAQNRIATVECLIRWIHPVHGFIPPDEFIPLAEQTGAIRDVTHWALRTAFAQKKEWADAGHTIGFAVNISAIDLVDMQLPAYVAELMSEFGADETCLTLEVTESAIMANPESAIMALNTLRRMGITLSIDDFGTGYSSMAQLKKMPVQELKIDKAFVLDLAKNEEDQVMVRTLVSLAQNLGLQTVAEGVEDVDALNFLGEIGCTKAQGYYLSRPLPADQFQPWLEKFSAETPPVAS